MAYDNTAQGGRDMRAGGNRPGGTAMLGRQVVSRIGLGTMQLPRLAPDRTLALRLLLRAYELGIDHVDTAQFYGHGFSNQVIRDSEPTSRGITIVSKVGLESSPSTNAQTPFKLAQRPEQLRASVQENLRHLGMEQLPVVNLRRFDVGPTIEAPDDQIVSLDDQLAEMVAMRDEGLIGGIGLSTVSLETLRSALPAGIACVQNAYSLVNRAAEEIAALCLSEGIAWVPYFPLGGAVPGSPKVSDELDAQAVAAELGVTTPQVGLAWLLRHASNTLLIPGTTSVKHLEQNTAAGDLVLNAAMAASLDAIATRRTGSPENVGASRPA